MVIYQFHVINERGQFVQLVTQTEKSSFVSKRAPLPIGMTCSPATPGMLSTCMLSTSNEFLCIKVSPL